MKLAELRLESYKRFESPTRIDMVPRVLALVGPNEAGKSSILTALTLLNEVEKPTALHRTHSSSDDMSVEAHFILTDEDRTALKDIPGGEKVKFYSFECRLEDDTIEYYYSLTPNPQRKLDARHQLAARLQSLAESENILAQFHSVGDVLIADVYNTALKILKSSSNSLSNQEIHSLKAFVTAIHNFTHGHGFDSPKIEQNQVSHQLADVLDQILNYDEGPSPSEQAAAILGKRRPIFRLFTTEDRSIESTYHMDSFSKPPRPLRNLANLANLDLSRLGEVAGPEQAGPRKTLLSNANKRLEAQFAGLWPQHELSVALDFNYPNLEITFTSADGEYTVPAERSDGLRSFVALRAFLASSSNDVLPILLVDEAETHLHYDAQANLVEMFTRQTLAEQVIYTTHSAGCLPMDLGNGIRVVEPIANVKRSKVRKSIWEGKYAGFSPLIFAMGATTFAFLPARNVLLTEGKCDAILLPTLFAEAKGGPLPFQVAPGISSASMTTYPQLQSEGGSVLFLVDGDGGGDTLKSDLRQAGAPARSIFSLSAIEENIVVEDLVDPTLYAKAANQVMSIYYHGTAKVTAADLPSPGRPDALARWCTAQGIKEPAKLDIAQALLDIKSKKVRTGESMQLLDPARRVKVRQLVTSLCRKFPDLPSYGN